MVPFAAHDDVSGRASEPTLIQLIRTVFGRRTSAPVRRSRRLVPRLECPLLWRIHPSASGRVKLRRRCPPIPGNFRLGRPARPNRSAADRRAKMGGSLPPRASRPLRACERSFGNSPVRLVFHACRRSRVIVDDLVDAGRAIQKLLRSMLHHRLRPHVRTGYLHGPAE